MSVTACKAEIKMSGVIVAPRFRGLMVLKSKLATVAIFAVPG